MCKKICRVRKYSDSCGPRLRTSSPPPVHYSFFKILKYLRGIKNEKSKDYCKADSELRVLFFHNNISACHTNLIQVYRCY